jgi:hypothetical protein
MKIIIGQRTFERKVTRFIAKHILGEGLSGEELSASCQKNLMR